MGMSTHVVGFRPPDEKFQKMKAVWEACEKAGVRPPREVDDFFKGERPDENGVVVPIERSICVREYKSDSEEGFEVDVTKLPPDVKIVRFYNAW